MPSRDRRAEADQLAHLRLAVELSAVAAPEVVLPSERDVVVEGMRIHYLDWGRAGATPVLFLHGGALTAHTWDVVCLALRGEYHCLALDQRGHGDSEWSPGMHYGPEAHCRDVEGFAEQLGLERFLLVGQSLGALNAFAYAAEHSGRLAGLVLVDAGPDVQIVGAKRIRDFVRATEEVDSVDDFVAQALVFNPLRDARLLRQSALSNLRQLPSGKWVRKHDPRPWTAEGFETFAARARSYWREPTRVACPTLVVRGALSDVLLDVDAERLALALPRGQWVRVEGAGHTVQGDNPRGLVRVLRQFFASLTLEHP